MARNPLLLGSLLLIASVLAAGPQEQCQGAPDECERQIRTMLQGSKFLGITMIESRWGPVIKTVVPDSPAHYAGLREGDRIVGINSFDCTHASPRDVKRMLTPLQQNALLTFVVFRVGEIKRFPVRFGILPKDQIDKIVEAHLRNGHSWSGERSKESARAADRQ